MRCWRPLALVLGLSVSGTPAAAQGPPAPRAHHQLAYHAAERRVYLLGGSTRRGGAYPSFDDIWAWTGTDWRRAGSLASPRSSHAVVYHAGRGSLVLFGGGSDGTFAADGALWEWRAGEWGRLGGSPDAGRAEPAMCYDAKSERIMAFGGWDEADEPSGVTWEWNGRDFVALDVLGPSPRAGHALVYDPVHERCLLFGGRGEGGFFSDTWVWDGAWQRIEVAGPSPRWFFGVAADLAGERIVLFGGNGPDGDLGDTWIWDREGWSLLAKEGPEPRGSARLAFDGEGVLLFGGRTIAPGGFRDHGDTWMLRGDAWTLLVPDSASRESSAASPALREAVAERRFDPS